MKLSDLLLDLKVSGEVIISVEDFKKMITCDDDFPDAKVIHVNPPLDSKILSYYGERKDND